MKRADSLDALRGLTIGMMVFCGTIVTDALPDWMAHCQVPPSNGHQFDPSIYGITWVDLVFPFFLFAMGAAMPFSIGSRIERGTRTIGLIGDGLWRGIKLAFFAIFIQNCYPWIVSGHLGRPADPGIWCFTLGAFLTLFLLFMRFPAKTPRAFKIAAPLVGIAIACFMMGWVESHVKLAPAFFVEHPNPTGYEKFVGHLNQIRYNSNIIILVLGNMAAFGTIIYVLTLGKPLVRIAILPFLMAILLGSNTEGSWQQAVFNWTPAAWLYQFYFLKYLFIIIPGTIAGEYLRNWIKDSDISSSAFKTKNTDNGDMATAIVAVISLALIAVNVTLLFGRHLTANLWATAAMIVVVNWAARRINPAHSVIRKLVAAGAYLLLLGLFFEAFEGGIRKDHSTYSYYFVTSGLAFYCLTLLFIVCDVYNWRSIGRPLAMAGRNPMIAYVATSMFFGPIFMIIGVYEPFMKFCSENWYQALLPGVLFTSLALGLAGFFSSKRLYWRT